VPTGYYLVPFFEKGKGCYRMVTDLEIEIIEQDVKELEREEAEQGYLGYRLPESAE
jgi:hypothetical protein